jgi:hypothetical protein
MSADKPVLSICIPTYNRGDRVAKLIREILRVQADIEVCLHVDGSTDATMDKIGKIHDPRLRVTSAANQGRGSALVKAINAARGDFTMLYDDDDGIYPNVLRSAIERCRQAHGSSFGGFIYHMDDEAGHRVGTPFKSSQSNFIKLRADERVAGDKKEIVRTGLLQGAVYDPKGAYRRTPTSLSWTRIALTHDAICINESIGVKRYLPGGLTSRIWPNKMSNAYPMHLLYRARCQAFLRGRYSSPQYFARSLLGLIGYGLLSLKERGGR